MSVLSYQEKGNLGTKETSQLVPSSTAWLRRPSAVEATNDFLGGYAVPHRSSVVRHSLGKTQQAANGRKNARRLGASAGRLFIIHSV